MRDTEDSSVESSLKTELAEEHFDPSINSENSRSQGVFGPLLWISGFSIFCYAAFFYDTTVSNNYAGEVVNIDLVRNQILIAIFGAACFCAGTTMHAISIFGEFLNSERAR